MALPRILVVSFAGIASETATGQLLALFFGNWNKSEVLQISHEPPPGEGWRGLHYEARVADELYKLCSAFDPDVVYDTVNDRFVLGIDGNGTDFCVAATQTGDPTGAWNRYGFPTNIKGAFFDFPHMGVGEEAIFMGSNQFGAPPYGFEGRI